MAAFGVESPRSDANHSLTERQYMGTEKPPGAKHGNFRAIGPWHSVNPEFLKQQVDRLTLPTSRTCNKGHINDAWVAGEECFKDVERSRTSNEIDRDQRHLHSGRKSERRGYSLPLKGEPRSWSALTTMSSRASTTNTLVGSPYKSVTAKELNVITHRVTRPTLSSQGGKTIAEKFENKDYVYGSRKASRDQLNGIVKRMTRSTVASTGGAGIPRRYTDHVIGGRTVHVSELEGINGRLTKHTVASLGGKPLANKDFNYNPPKITKTNLCLDEKYKIGMKKKVTDKELQAIMFHLSRSTIAYGAKCSPNPHVWIDDAIMGPFHPNRRTFRRAIVASLGTSNMATDFYMYFKGM